MLNVSPTFNAGYNLKKKPQGLQPSQACVDGNAASFDSSHIGVFTGWAINATTFCGRDDLDHATIIGPSVAAMHPASVHGVTPYACGAASGEWLCRHATILNAHARQAAVS